MRYLLLVVLCGCGGGVKYNSSTTRGVACADFSEALCERLVACNLVTDTRAQCESGVQAACCGTGKTCGERVVSPAGAADCVNRMPGEECAAFGTTTMPALPSYCRQMF
jgi:hypothetical protein